MPVTYQKSAALITYSPPWAAAFYQVKKRYALHVEREKRRLPYQEETLYVFWFMYCWDRQNGTDAVFYFSQKLPITCKTLRLTFGETDYPLPRRQLHKRHDVINTVKRPQRPHTLTIYEHAPSLHVYYIIYITNTLLRDFLYRIVTFHGTGVARDQCWHHYLLCTCWRRAKTARLTWRCATFSFTSATFARARAFVARAAFSLLHADVRSLLVVFFWSLTLCLLLFISLV